MTTILQFAEEVFTELEKVAPVKSVEEKFAYMAKYSGKFIEGFKAGESKATNPTCEQEHAGECGVCKNNVFYPCA